MTPMLLLRLFLVVFESVFLSKIGRFARQPYTSRTIGFVNPIRCIELKRIQYAVK